MTCVPQAGKLLLETQTFCVGCALLLMIGSEVNTLTGMQGYSGQVAATASAPSVFVLRPIPTKNSLMR